MSEEEDLPQVINKMEPLDLDSEMEDVKTTVLRNMSIVETAADHILTDHLELVGNSDGNLEINTIQHLEEAIEENIGENDDTDDQEIEEMEGQDDFIEEDVLAEDDSLMEEGTLIEDNSLSVHDSMGEDQIYLEDNSENVDDPDYEGNYSKKEKDTEINPCTICERIFKTPASLKRHVTVCHAIEEEQDDPLAFELCLCCGEPVDSAHTSGDFKCDHCEKLFAIQNSLDRHRSIDHSEGGVWQCVECSSNFPERAQLMEHMQQHPLNKLYSCRQCNREFTRKYHLDRHVAQTGCDGTPRNVFQCQLHPPPPPFPQSYYSIKSFVTFRWPELHSSMILGPVLHGLLRSYIACIKYDTNCIL